MRGELWFDNCSPSPNAPQDPARTVTPETSFTGNALPANQEYYSLSWVCGDAAAQRRLAREITRRTVAGRLINRYKGQFLIEAALYKPTAITAFGPGGQIFAATPDHRAPLLNYIYDDTLNSTNPRITIIDGCQTSIINNLRSTFGVRVVVRVLYTEAISPEPAFGAFLRAMASVAGFALGGVPGAVLSTGLSAASNPTNQQNYANFLNKFQNSVDISAPFEFPTDKTRATITFDQGLRISINKVGRESLMYVGSVARPAPGVRYVSDFASQAYVDVRSYSPNATETANMQPADAIQRICITVAQKIAQLNLSDRDRLMLTYAYAGSLPYIDQGKPCFQDLDVDALTAMGWTRAPYRGAYPPQQVPVVVGNR